MSILSTRERATLIWFLILTVFILCFKKCRKSIKKMIILLLNLYGRVFRYFANIFNNNYISFDEHGVHNKKMKNELEIAKKYCEFCKIIK